MWREIKERKKQYSKFLKAGEHSKHNNKPSKNIYISKTRSLNYAMIQEPAVQPPC